MKVFIINLIQIAIPIVVIAVPSIYLCIITSVNPYVPEIKITVSEDNGKSYTGNLKSIPKYKDIYVKCEVSVKANGLWWRFFSSIIQFTIEPPNGFELCDYTGLQKAGKDKTKKAVKEVEESLKEAENALKEAEESLKEAKNALEKSENTLEKSEKAFKEAEKAFKEAKNALKPEKEQFFAVASNRPKKTEIIFKLPKNTIEKDCALIFSFNWPILNNVYNKTVTLGLIPPSWDSGR